MNSKMSNKSSCLKLLMRPVVHPSGKLVGCGLLKVSVGSKLSHGRNMLAVIKLLCFTDNVTVAAYRILTRAPSVW